ncbi:MAG: hypothetical protein Q8P49_03330, partial [Candidatus Liptonbacteria bacterium]|nr:hypothetical protein [Candidatus Liptonbacteria bacterium]
ALSRHRIKKLGLAAHANIYWKSFWHEDLSRFDAIIVYGYPPIMEKLGAKLKREMKPGAKVISLVYPFPGRSPDESRETGQYKLYIYRYPGA